MLWSSVQIPSRTDDWALMPPAHSTLPSAKGSRLPKVMTLPWGRLQATTGPGKGTKSQPSCLNLERL